MCVIVHQPKEAHLTKDRAERLWGINDDGGGFSFIDNTNAIVTEKYMDFQEYWRNFEKARSLFSRRDFLLHMRIATHGTINLDNVHPFQVDEHTVMAHNGIIKNVPEYKGDERSDTRVFIDEVLPELPSNWLDSPYLVEMVENWIGWSKLMFLTTSPALKQTVYILNKDSGTEADKMWFSNNAGVHVTQPKKTYSVDSLYSHAWDEWEDRWSESKGGVLRPKYLKQANKPSATKTLWEQRKTSMLFHAIFWDKAEKAWMCEGCIGLVDDVTGECDCWDMICVDCESFAADCLCTSGSVNLVHFDKATAHQKNKAWMNGGRQSEVIETW